MVTLIKTDNGFPSHWKAGSLESEIKTLLENKITSQRYDKVLLLNTTWMHDSNISKHIELHSPDFICATNFVDPAIPNLMSEIRNSKIPYILIGNCKEFRLDFWGMVCAKFFKDYDENELYLNHNAKRFICYNRKPHPHRIHIAQNLHEKVGNLGYVSLGLPDDPIILEEQFNDWQGINDEFDNLSGQPQFVDDRIRNDIFSLGDIDRWRNALFCIVTETEWHNQEPMDFFISEKTWKPIIGMRPFMIYGQPRLRDYLKQQGFDIFEDIVDYSIADRARPYDKMDGYLRTAMSTIASITDPMSIFQSLLPRLKNNRIRFDSYIGEQWQKLRELNFDAI